MEKVEYVKNLRQAIEEAIGLNSDPKWQRQYEADKVLKEKFAEVYKSFALMYDISPREMFEGIRKGELDIDGKPFRITIDNFLIHYEPLERICKIKLFQKKSPGIWVEGSIEAKIEKLEKEVILSINIESHGEDEEIRMSKILEDGLKKVAERYSIKRVSETHEIKTIEYSNQYSVYRARIGYLLAKLN